VPGYLYQLSPRLLWLRDLRATAKRDLVIKTTPPHTRAVLGPPSRDHIDRMSAILRAFNFAVSSLKRHRFDLKQLLDLKRPPEYTQCLWNLGIGSDEESDEESEEESDGDMFNLITDNFIRGQHKFWPRRVPTTPCIVGLISHGRGAWWTTLYAALFTRGGCGIA